MRNKKNKKGFTLLELMVAMGVIAILAAMSIYGISLVQKSLRNTARRKAAQDINLAVQQYYEATANYPAYNTAAGIRFFADRVEVNSQVVYRFTGATVPQNTTTAVDSTYTRYCYSVNAGSYKISVDLEGSLWGLQLGEPSLPNCTTPVAVN